MAQKPRRRPESLPLESPQPRETPELRPAAGETSIDDGGLWLEELGAAFAELMHEGADPYEPGPEPAGMTDLPPAVARPEPIDEETGVPASGASDDACEVSPRTILEAMLFVGHPHNEPITSQEVASRMRGVRPDEIDELVRELNEEYAADKAPYSIASVGAGYLLKLRDEFAGLHEKFSGKVREARLSQAAIDVLAIVAYQQPITRTELEKLRGHPSGAVLSQLVRRDLLRIERTDEKPRQTRYYTTDRFLAFFGLESLNDLPRSQDLDRNL